VGPGGQRLGAGAGARQRLARLLGRAAEARGWAGGWRAERGKGERGQRAENKEGGGEKKKNSFPFYFPNKFSKSIFQ